MSTSLRKGQNKRVSRSRLRDPLSAIIWQKENEDEKYCEGHGIGDGPRLFRDLRKLLVSPDNGGVVGDMASRSSWTLPSALTYTT